MLALDLHLSTFIILYVIILAIAYVVWRIKKSQIDFKGIALVVLYALLLFKVTICPIVFLREESRPEFVSVFGNSITYYQLIPFKTMMNTIHTDGWILQILGNILLLFPMPLLCGILSKEKVKARKLIGMGIVTSLIIEVLQLGIDVIGHYPSHVMDIDDMILNTLGVVIATIVVIVVQEKPFFLKIKNTFRKIESL